MSFPRSVVLLCRRIILIQISDPYTVRLKLIIKTLITVIKGKLCTRDDTSYTTNYLLYHILL